MIDEFKRYLKREGKSLKTILLYSNTIEEFERWYVESHNCQFSSLRKSDIYGFQDYLIELKKYKPSTVKVKICILHKFSSFIVSHSA